MTITVEPTRNEYTATAGQTLFSYTFKIFAATDLNVYVTPAGQTADDTTDIVTGYAVTGLGDEDGGTITLVVAASINDLVTIVSDIPESRTTNYVNNGDFLPPVVNADFDRVVSLTKQTEDRTNRTLGFQQSQQDAADLSLPAPTALQFMRWKADESGMENATISTDPTIISDTAYGAGWDGDTETGASKNAIYDEMQLQAKATLTAGGDILYASAANILARLAKGTANFKLFMNAAGTAPEWDDGVYIGTFTREMDGATATGVYTGLGFKPSDLLFFAAVNTTAIASVFGMSFDSNDYVLYDNHNVSADTFAVDGGNCILLVEAAGKSQSAVISARGADGFSLDWTRTGITAAGTANIFYMARR